MDIRLMVLLLGMLQSDLPAAATFDFPAPPMASLSGPYTLWATYYAVQTVVESEFGIPYKDTNGLAITGNIAPRDWCLGAIEGTIGVSSHSGTKTLNFAKTQAQSQVDCAKVLKVDPVKRPWIASVGKSVFTLARGAFGDGVANFELVPWRTIAVDPALIPIGTTLYIPAARGLMITVGPGKTVPHDGYFFAADRGGGISGSHIDVFCGNSSANCMPSIASGSSTHTFEAFRVTNSDIADALRHMHLGMPPAPNQSSN